MIPLSVQPVIITLTATNYDSVLSDDFVDLVRVHGSTLQHSHLIVNVCFQDEDHPPKYLFNSPRELIGTLCCASN